MSESLPEIQPPNTRRHEEAIALAAQAAARWGFSAELFRDSVLGVRDDVDAYARALHGVERRIVRLRTISGPGRSRAQGSLPSPAQVDPWTVDVNALAEATRVVAWCPSCLGSGAAKCLACRGAGKMRCPRCEGAGVDGGGAACGQCGGAKKLPCAECQGARLPCGECASSGEVTAWLEVERSTRPVVVVHPLGAAARAHPGVSEAADFDLDPSRFVAARVEDTGERPAGAATGALLPARLDASERVVTTRIQRFQAVRCLVTYGTALATGVVVVGGSPPEVEAGADWRPIELRRNVTAVFAVVAVGLAVALAAGRASRHPWYQQGTQGAWLMVFAVALALAATWTLAGALLAAPARTPLRAWVPAGALMLVTGALALVAAGARPRAAHARASFDSGDFSGAALEADALRALDIDRAAGEAVLDRIHLRELAIARDPAAKAAAARAPWHRGEARDEARRAVAAAIERAAGDGDPARLEALVALAREFAPPLGERLARDGALARARACAEAGDGRCVRAETTRALEHGAEPAQTDPVIARGRARCAESLAALVSAADAARAPTAEAAPLRDAIARSEGCTALTQEPTAPTADVLRSRLADAEARAAQGGSGGGEPARHGGHRARRR